MSNLRRHLIDIRERHLGELERVRPREAAHGRGVACAVDNLQTCIQLAAQSDFS